MGIPLTFRCRGIGTKLLSFKGCFPLVIESNILILHHVSVWLATNNVALRIKCFAYTSYEEQFHEYDAEEHTIIDNFKSSNLAHDVTVLSKDKVSLKVVERKCSANSV